jgi:hypothetical protein
MKVEAGRALADCRSSIEGRVGAAICKSDMDRPGLIDLRRYGGDLAEIRPQVLSVEPMQRGRFFRLEAHDELGEGVVRQPHADEILPVDEPKEATTDRDLGDVAVGICQARFWPFRAGGIGPDFKDPIAEIIEDENQRAKPDREAPEQAPKGAQDS